MCSVQMKKRLTEVSLHQTSKVCAIGLVIVIFLPCVITGMVSASHDPFFIIAPFVYGFISYLLFVILFFVYNCIARCIGGIEFTVSDADDTGNKGSLGKHR
jgi:hypothetical protein